MCESRPMSGAMDETVIRCWMSDAMGETTVREMTVRDTHTHYDLWEDVTAVLSSVNVQ